MLPLYVVFVSVVAAFYTPFLGPFPSV
jgi:hypothetical protein